MISDVNINDLYLFIHYSVYLSLREPFFIVISANNFGAIMKEVEGIETIGCFLLNEKMHRDLCLLHSWQQGS